MPYIDLTKYSDEIAELLGRITAHQGRYENGEEVEIPYMTDEEKQEFMNDLKSFIDLPQIPFAEKMVALSYFAKYSREVTEFLFGKE